LVGKFLLQRRAINAICLSTNASVLTAWANDVDYETVFSRQVEAHAQPGAVLWAISTSGNSPNVVSAVKTARELGVKVIGMTGEGGGKLAGHCDVLLDVPSKATPRIQEVHLVWYHYLCEALEAEVAESSK
jgi:D-sedoheptulose 7-phosphate isomerase